MSRESDLLHTALLLTVTTPGFGRMRRQLEPHPWAAQLVELAQPEELRPLRPALEYVANTGLVGTTEDGFGPLLDAMHRHGADIDGRLLLRASTVAQQAVSERPHASFALAWATLLLWIVAAQERGEALYYEGPPVPGRPHPGWGTIPAAAIAAAVKLKGLYGSAVLATEAYEVLWASAHRHSYQRETLEPAIATYRRLGLEIARRREQAIGSLVDDLRAACGERHGPVRVFVAAILWSLGQLPECGAVLAAEEAPSRSVLRRLVDDSITLLPDDPLLQYLWLELKDEPSFDLRHHEALFAVIDHFWGQWSLDVDYDTWGMSAAPSRLYARTLVRLLANDLDEKGAAEYGAVYNLIVDLGHTLPSSGWVMPRLHLLRHLIGLRFNFYRDEITGADHVERLKVMVEAAARHRAQAARYPEVSDARGRLAPSVFELIERCLGDDADLPWSDQERSAMLLESVERYRTGALAYWLQVAPPIVPAADTVEVPGLLQRERELRTRLRGSYFLVLRPILPLQYAWNDMDMGRLLDLHSDPAARQRFHSADVARGEMEGIERQLADLGQELRAHAPELAAHRLSPHAELGRVVELLNAHTRPAPPAGER